MEQQSSDPSTPNSKQRGSNTIRSTPSINLAQSDLSGSEPSLRFPCPQGSRELANWISSSNPDIMRLTTTTEDTGLADSTYELISGTDTESQDGNYTESMGESVGSLDFHRPDDVHSLADTEQTHDEDEDEQSVVDDNDVAPPNFDQFHGDLHDEALPDYTRDAADESEDEARSRSSLEYTQTSLKTPSIQTPEASKIVERTLLDRCHLSMTHYYESLSKKLDTFWEAQPQIQQRIGRLALTTIPPLLLAVSAIIYLFTVARAPGMTADIASSSTAAPVVVTSPPHVPLSRVSAAPKATPSFSGGVGLIPINDVASDDWLFGSKQPNVTFATRAPKEVLVHVPASVKRAWRSTECLSITATRHGNSQVSTFVDSVDEGFLVRFPKNEAHGILTLAVTSSCRPKVHKEVKTHFGYGIMDEAREFGRIIAHDLGELVPAVAHEAERCFVDAKKSLAVASDTLGVGAHTLSDSLFKSLQVGLANAQKSLSMLPTAGQSLAKVGRATKGTTKALSTFVQRAQKHVPSVQHTQERINLGVLNAQISAKLLWLKAIGKMEEHATYEKKAKAFLSAKRDAVCGVVRKATDAQEQPRSWARIFSRA
ncbi:hypothetical protein B0I35DRAFT_483352 [Stachybotrys elegans]|uniref:Uncharacterized protein n=1 Tax=Stachybotrys elegans TaxID=80388 RepID=A0A8K0SC96_9HYPO|nr:hypothetical protein B0I35DRAFT_483352 [Stachybotrys elegans]